MEREGAGAQIYVASGFAHPSCVVCVRGAAWVGWRRQQGVHRWQVAESGTLTLVKYSVRNIKYPKVIKLQFASPLD